MSLVKRRLVIVADIYVNEDQSAMDAAMDVVTADGEYDLDGWLMDARWDNLLPDDAEHVAYTLEHGPDPDDSPEEKAETFVRAMARALEILRGGS
jgi:hypothetical protein